MKRIFKKSTFEYTTANDEIQNRTNDSLLIHYDNFLIQLEITDTPSRASWQLEFVKGGESQFVQSWNSVVKCEGKV